MQSCKEELPANKGNTIFMDFQKRIVAISDSAKRQKAADDFIKRVKTSTYPIYENDTTVVLLYQGNMDSVGILGDMGMWAKTIPMKRIPGTNLFYYRAHFEPQARLQYWFMLGKNALPVTDPLNPYKVLNGFGPNSELAMPQYKRHPYFTEFSKGKKGTYLNLESRELPKGILPYSHQIEVYLPEEYKYGNKKYPVVYFQDGKDYIEYAAVPYVLNRMIKEGKIEPLIAVFVTPPNRHKPAMPNRMTEYGLNDDYVKFFTEELVSFIDKNYRTQKNANSRLVVGDSFGGLISAYIPLMRPDVFALGYSQSGYQSFHKDQLIKAYANKRKQPIRLYVDVGTYERNVGADLLPSKETDFLMANRRLKKILQEKKYDFVYKEYPEGHTWGNWRRHLIDALTYFFGVK